MGKPNKICFGFTLVSGTGISETLLRELEIYKIPDSVIKMDFYLPREGCARATFTAMVHLPSLME